MCVCCCMHYPCLCWCMYTALITQMHNGTTSTEIHLTQNLNNDGQASSMNEVFDMTERYAFGSVAISE